MLLRAHVENFELAISYHQIQNGYEPLNSENKLQTTRGYAVLISLCWVKCECNSPLQNNICLLSVVFIPDKIIKSKFLLFSIFSEVSW